MMGTFFRSLVTNFRCTWSRCLPAPPPNRVIRKNSGPAIVCGVKEPSVEAGAQKHRPIAPRCSLARADAKPIIQGTLVARGLGTTTVPLREHHKRSYRIGLPRGREDSQPYGNKNRVSRQLPAPA